MQRFRRIFCTVLLSALAAVLLIPQCGFADETVTLTYSNFFPPTHVQSKMTEEWVKEVEKRTNGKVKIDYFPGNTLTSAKQCYDGVVQGISDIGMSALAYSKGRFPVMAVVDLPLGYKTGVAASNVANKVYEKFKPAELDDVEVMYFHAHGPGVLNTRGKPVRTLEDMKGLKLRATGNSAQVVKALGGTPVAMSMPDSYQSIQKGIVDGGIYPMETNKGWNMAEVVDYCTLSYPAGYTTTFFVVMNKDRWNSLPKDVQDTIRQINKEWVGKHGQAWDQSDEVGKQFLLEQKDEIIELDPAEAKRWKNAMQPIMDNYVKEMDKKKLNGEEILTFTEKTLADEQ